MDDHTRNLFVYHKSGQVSHLFCNWILCLIHLSCCLKRFDSLAFASLHSQQEQKHFMQHAFQTKGTYFLVFKWTKMWFISRLAKSFWSALPLPNKELKACFFKHLVLTNVIQMAAKTKRLQVLVSVSFQFCITPTNNSENHLDSFLFIFQQSQKVTYVAVFAINTAVTQTSFPLFLALYTYQMSCRPYRAVCFIARDCS